MCSHYQGLKTAEQYKGFRVAPPAGLGVADVWPGYVSAFIRRHPHADVGDDAVPAREALTGRFGLVPPWAKDLKARLSTFNARSETAAEKPTFRDAWRRGQFCIIPAEAIFEPDWRTGKARAARISRADGEPMGIAGLWSEWRSPDGEIVYSHTMLTVNADDHPFMRNYHKATDEKRMVVLLPEDSYDAWLTAKPSQAMDFMRQFGAEKLVDAEAPALLNLA